MNTNKKNILWVDDDVNRMALLPDRDALEEKGYNIIAIDRVDDFLHFIKEDSRQIDCIILDIHMATGDLNSIETQNGTRTGIPLYNIIQKTPKYKNTIIVIYSVFKKEDLGKIGEEDKIVFLLKDLKSSEFANTISNLVG